MEKGRPESFVHFSIDHFFPNSKFITIPSSTLKEMRIVYKLMDNFSDLESFYEIEDKKKSTLNTQSEISSQNKETSNQNEETSNQNEETSNQTKEVSNQNKETSNQNEETSNQIKETSNQTKEVSSQNKENLDEKNSNNHKIEPQQDSFNMWNKSKEKFCWKGKEKKSKQKSDLFEVNEQLEEIPKINSLELIKNLKLNPEPDLTLLEDKFYKSISHSNYEVKFLIRKTIRTFFENLKRLKMGIDINNNAIIPTAISFELYKFDEACIPRLRETRIAIYAGIIGGIVTSIIIISGIYMLFYIDRRESLHRIQELSDFKVDLRNLNDVEESSLLIETDFDSFKRETKDFYNESR